MSITTVIPTRGMVYAETLLSIQRNRLAPPIIVSGLPLPESHNECVRCALKDYVSYILFVEDDMVLPDGAIEEMVKVNAPIVALDYPMDNGYSTICRQDGRILWCGLGCTLINASVFRNIPEPWFETNYSYRIEEPFKLTRIENPNKYGGHDINFFIKARKWGYTAASLEGFEAKHLRSKPIRTQDNNGGYEIVALPPVSKRQNY